MLIYDRDFVEKSSACSCMPCSTLSISDSNSSNCHLRVLDSRKQTMRLSLGFLLSTAPPFLMSSSVNGSIIVIDSYHTTRDEVIIAQSTARQRAH